MASTQERRGSNPFADESFEEGDYLDLAKISPAGATQEAEGKSGNPFVSPRPGVEDLSFLVMGENESSFRERQSELDRELCFKSSVVDDDTFRSEVPDDDFNVNIIDKDCPLLDATSPFQESQMVPITTEKETILSNFKQYNLDTAELQLISNLPDAVAKAALEQIQRGHIATQEKEEEVEAEEEHIHTQHQQEEAEDEEDDSAAVFLASQTQGGRTSGAPIVARSPQTPFDVDADEERSRVYEEVVAQKQKRTKADRPRPTTSTEEEEKETTSEDGNTPTPRDSAAVKDLAKVEAIDNRLQHIEEVVVSLKHRREESNQEEMLSVIKEQEHIIAQRDETIHGLASEKDLVLAKLQDLMDERDIKSKMMERENASMGEMSKVIEEYESRLDSSGSEKKQLLDKIEYLLGERRDFNKLESSYEGLRNDNIHLQEALQDERRRSQTLAKEVKDYSLIHHETSSLCTEYKSKFEKAESDIQSMKEYIVDYNTHNYNLRLQIEELLRENKLLRAETVNLKLDVTHSQQEISRLSKEVKKLEATKQQLLLSPSKSQFDARRAYQYGMETEIPGDDERYSNPHSGRPGQEGVVAYKSGVSNMQTRPIHNRIQQDSHYEQADQHRSHHHPQVEYANDANDRLRSEDDYLVRVNIPERRSVNVEASSRALSVSDDVKENIKANRAERSSDRSRDGGKTCPYAVDKECRTSADNDLQRTERQLLKMNMERSRLESQYAKMPASSGKTLAQRKQKREIEERLTKLNKEISSCRLTLKRLSLAR